MIEEIRSTPFKTLQGKLEPVEGRVKAIHLYRAGESSSIEISESPGSVRVYANMLGFEDGKISEHNVYEFLDQFSEYLGDVKGKHPNIDRLHEVQSTGIPIFASIEYEPGN
jgi:hypothetical protein